MFRMLTNITRVLPTIRRSNPFLITSIKRECNQMSDPTPPCPARVTLLGANGPLGQMSAYLLKQSPLISELTLYDVGDTNGVALDLSHINTSCMVRAYNGASEIQEALECADIVVMTGGHRWRINMPPIDLFNLNAGMVRMDACACASVCPCAIIAVATDPVNALVPVVSEVFKRENVYDPDKIIGMCTSNVVRANAIVGMTHYLEPEYIHVPVIGGVSADTNVPLLSRAQPYNDFPEEIIDKISTEIRFGARQITAAQEKSSVISRAYAVNRFVLTLIRGINNYPDAVMSAYVRSNVLPHCKYLSTQLLFGPEGVKKNFGIPKITEYELDLLEIAVNILLQDIKMGEDYVTDYIKNEKSNQCIVV